MSWNYRVLIRKKINTKNCSTKFQINTLPVRWGIRKIHTKINFKWQIISEKSLLPERWVLYPTRRRHQRHNKRRSRTNFLSTLYWTNTRNNWLSNNGGFLDGDSDWFVGVWAKSGTERSNNPGYRIGIYSNSNMAPKLGELNKGNHIEVEGWRFFSL